jgi:hypothetical protein
MYSVKPGLVIGFHGCDQEVCDKIVSGAFNFKSSSNDYDWLGNGMYFWEYNEQRALQFAKELKEAKRKGVPEIKKPAVLGAVLSLGNCLDLLEMEYLKLVRFSYDNMVLSYASLELPLPKNTKGNKSNDLLLRRLDCAVIENLHQINPATPFDSVRGVFVEGDELYPNAGFHEKNHIQICIRNPNCIKGFFYPRKSVIWP